MTRRPMALRVLRESAVLGGHLGYAHDRQQSYGSVPQLRWYLDHGGRIALALTPNR